MAVFCLPYSSITSHDSYQLLLYIYFEHPDQHSSLKHLLCFADITISYCKQTSTIAQSFNLTNRKKRSMQLYLQKPLAFDVFVIFQHTWHSRCFEYTSVWVLMFVTCISTILIKETQHFPIYPPHSRCIYECTSVKSTKVIWTFTFHH